MFARLPTIGHAETETSFNLPRVQRTLSSKERDREKEKFFLFSKHFDCFHPMDENVVFLSFFFLFFSSERGAFNRDGFYFVIEEAVKDDAREKFFFLLKKLCLSFIS